MIQTAAIIPVFIAFFVSAVLGPVIIPILNRLKMDQTERDFGVKSHLAKNGTPTMGGTMILLAVTVTSLIFIWKYPKIGPVLFLTLAFGMIGFVDDYLKVVKKRSDGLFPKQKMAFQIVVTAVFCAYLVNIPGMSLDLRLPFTGGVMWHIGFWAYPLLFIAVIGTVNGVNFTDGLDGLASSVTIVVALFFTIASVILEARTAPIPAAVMGALMGFLIWNAYPARVFMGDTGSLALGGFVAGMAYILQMPLYILLVGLIYLIEVLSVMIQVAYFKYTKKKYGEGRRIFKMTPIHHHFELSGWSETKVVAVFTIVTALLALLALLAI